jgi:putative heme transporter
MVSHVRGTTVIAGINAVLVGLALWLLGVPLLIPLAIVVFVAAFVPLVGRLIRLHPLAVILALAVGGTVAGIRGAAIVAVPAAGIISHSWPYLRDGG